MEGSTAGSVDGCGSSVSTMGSEVSTGTSGILLIDTSVHANASNGIKNFILPSTVSKNYNHTQQQRMNKEHICPSFQLYNFERQRSRSKVNKQDSSIYFLKFSFFLLS